MADPPKENHLNNTPSKPDTSKQLDEGNKLLKDTQELVSEATKELREKRKAREERLNDRNDKKTIESADDSDRSKTTRGQHYYNTEVKLPPRTELAQNTYHAVDKALDNMTRIYLQGGEVRRMAWLRPVLPFLAGIGAGILKPLGNIFGGLWYGAAITGILSPVTSLVRRITGENAFSQFARFANRAEDRGLASRIIHGGESRAVKAFFLKEDKDIRQLLRLKDQKIETKEDLNRLGIGSRDRIDNLIASGVMAGMKVQMIQEHNAQLSEKENDKLKRLQDAYLMAKTLMDAKIPSQGQKEIFINDVLPNLVRKKERELWLKQTAGITGVGLLKSSAMVILGNVFTFTNINNLLGAAGDAAGRVWKGWTNLTNDWIKPNFVNGMKIPDNIQQWMGEWGKNAQWWLNYYFPSAAAAPVITNPPATGLPPVIPDTVPIPAEISPAPPPPAPPVVESLVKNPPLKVTTTINWKEGYR